MNRSHSTAPTMHRHRIATGCALLSAVLLLGACASGFDRHERLVIEPRTAVRVQVSVGGKGQLTLNNTAPRALPIEFGVRTDQRQPIAVGDAPDHLEARVTRRWTFAGSRVLFITNPGVEPVELALEFQGKGAMKLLVNPPSAVLSAPAPVESRSLTEPMPGAAPAAHADPAASEPAAPEPAPAGEPVLDIPASTPPTKTPTGQGQP